MALYEYECACGHQFERVTGTGNEETKICPKCGADAPRKEFSVPAPFQWAPGAKWN